MASSKKDVAEDPEITAITSVHNALRGIDAIAQERVLRYVAGKLGVALRLSEDVPTVSAEITDRIQSPAGSRPKTADNEIPESSEGVSSVALKWMKRNGIANLDFTSLFSLGGDEIDLVARNVPGKSKRERMHNVLLLKGIAAYLGTGVARVAHNQLKEACLHYDAYDSANFATSLRALTAEVGGTKEAGYSLNARGLTAATELIKSLLTPKA